MSLTKPEVQPNADVLKDSNKLDYHSDSCDSTDSSSSSNVSVPSSIKSVSTNTHRDFGASPKCLKCAKHKLDFGSLGNYKSYNINEHPGNFHCSTCGNGYSTDNQLQNHINTVHLEMVHKFPIADCEAHFLMKIGIDNHVTLHEGKKMYLFVTYVVSILKHCPN